ncbi:phage tail sheath subtilisin-like domain-containing protein [Sneathiella sp.]|uniref:phage tail sheath subtilisin-like domain-containing protein n=1 Tax=Sneathiella sp. TaxID=1964365 RepID=UPI002FE0FFC7
MSMIAFNQVPVDLRRPGQYIEYDNRRAVRGLVGMPRKILMIGQMLSTATVAEATPVPVTDPAGAAVAFGYGSMLHQMAIRLRDANNYHQLVCMGLADASAGTAASGDISFTATSVKAGTLNLWIGGRRIRVGVKTGDAATVIATAVAAAINGDGMLPVTAAVDGEDAFKVNLTARHKGELGNSIDVRINYYDDEFRPLGLTVAITAMSGGTGNPEIDSVIAAMGPTWYTDIITPYTDATNLAALEAELEDRFGPMEMQDGIAYSARAGTHGALSTFGDGRNSPSVTIIGINGCPTPPWEIAAAYGGVISFNAAIDPARDYQTLRLPGVLAPATDAQFTDMEQELLLYEGITPTYCVGSDVHITRAITTYQVNAQGLEDTSYLRLVTMTLLAYLRYSERHTIATTFPRFKLADNGTRPSANVITPDGIRNELISLYKKWEGAGLVHQVDEFIEELRVERDPNNPDRVNVLNPAKLIGNFLIYASKIQYSL